MATAVPRFATFREFYPYYLGEHRHPVCRRLHYLGTTLAIGAVLIAAVTGETRWLLLLPLVGYAPAWAGHFFFEHNKPATFYYPLWSLAGDFVMFAQMLTGRLPPLSGKE